MSTEPVPIPEGSTRDTDPLHTLLQQHIGGCSTCRHAIEMEGDKSHNRTSGNFGVHTSMCDSYLNLVSLYYRGETNA